MMLICCLHGDLWTEKLETKFALYVIIYSKYILKIWFLVTKIWSVFKN